MKKLLAASTVLFSVSACASNQEWQLVWVTHGIGWETTKARGSLKQTGNVLEGVLADEKDGRADFRLRIEIVRGSAKGTLEVLSENDGSSKLEGTYKKWPHSKDHCPELIQLMNEHEYLGLARNACQP